ncbi:tyrosine-type recombinase/integrase [Paracoccus sp. (in: a-proteobacteria)]|uniref:tyrosine-type recombinase/integrase n=1 Tax=Paracoccus sp. TaxID=267 RepID=UPI0026E0201E|nr:tyrosine-type recombinase/integrase [Paracoccus sp. (in: a-proteobacteria)]MDO5647031.1 tyrosine-type recombinase/integrase [Paracoccus sp. (in: a-proteobacteria)]
MSLPVTPAHLSPADDAALTELYRRGTPQNTLRAWERDLVYITAWKAAAFNAPLEWPEAENVALRFVLDHSVDVTDAAGPARQVADALIAAGLRRSLACPAPSTLDRRIASWQAFHRMKNLPSPFDAPLIRQARGRARRAAARPVAPKSDNPITRAVLEQMLATCDHSHRGMRDRAALMLGWASGGRRRSEIVALNRDDIDDRDFDGSGLLRIRLLVTKTTGPQDAPRLPLKGRAARAVMIWLRAARISDGPVFRPISKTDRVLPRRLDAASLRDIVRNRLVLAGYPPDFASTHGLRSGFLTQAALDGAPLVAAMQLSLHRSAAQAQRYYADIDIADNPATDLLG